MEAPEYDPSIPNGGNPLEVDVNAQYSGYEFHWTYILICSYLVFMIVPGVALLYGGLSRRRSALAMLFQGWMVTAVVTFQWMFWGYSLTYARNASPFIGTLAHIGMRDVVAAPSPGSANLPEIVFCLYQLMFAIVTAMLVVGGAFDRGRILPTLVFTFIWVTVVYCPIACWTWNANGWLYNLPSLDYAGGGPVHIASGCSALAYALILGKRRTRGDKHLTKPHNISMVFIGTILIWFGWFGFNGGSTLNANVRAGMAAFNTNTAAAMGTLGWCFVQFIKNKGKFSLVGACEGAIAGLVGITPAAGYVSVWLAAAIGVLTGICCALLENINDWVRIDEGLDVFKLHGCGGMIGSFLTGIFATSSISALDGSLVAEGGVDGNGVQIARQLADIASVASYSFTVTCVILLVIKYIPGLHLRVREEDELKGLDFAQFIEEDVGDWSHGRFGMHFDDSDHHGGRSGKGMDGVLDGKTVIGTHTPRSDDDALPKKEDTSA